MAYVLDGLLRLLHPIIPFITEAIWRQLNAVCPQRGLGDQYAEELLITAAWPEARGEWINADLEQKFDLLRDLVRGIRQVRTAHNVPPSRELEVAVRADGADAALLLVGDDLVRSQARLAKLEVRPDAAKADERAATVVVGRLTAFIADVVDVAAEKTRLAKELAILQRGLASTRGKLSNEKFLGNAPAEVVQSEKTRLAEMESRLAAVEQAMRELQ